MGFSEFLDKTLATAYGETAASRARDAERIRAQKEARLHKSNMFNAAREAHDSAMRRGDKVAASIAEVEMMKWLNYRP